MNSLSPGTCPLLLNLTGRYTSVPEIFSVSGLLISGCMTPPWNKLNLIKPMMNIALRIFTSTLLLLSISFQLKGQIKEITFGEIPKEDLEMAEYAPDQSADAVI